VGVHAIDDDHAVLDLAENAHPGRHDLRAETQGAAQGGELDPAPRDAGRDVAAVRAREAIHGAGAQSPLQGRKVEKLFGETARERRRDGDGVRDEIVHGLHPGRELEMGPDHLKSRRPVSQDAEAPVGLLADQIDQHVEAVLGDAFGGRAVVQTVEFDNGGGDVGAARGNRGHAGPVESQVEPVPVVMADQKGQPSPGRTIGGAIDQVAEPDPAGVGDCAAGWAGGCAGRCLAPGDLPDRRVVGTAQAARQDRFDRALAAVELVGGETRQPSRGPVRARDIEDLGGGMAKIGQHLEGVRAQRQRPLVGPHGFDGIAEIAQRVGEIVVALEQVRIVQQGLAVGLGRFDVAPHRPQHVAEVVVRDRLFRPQGDRLFQALARLLQAAAAPQGYAHVAQRIGRSGVVLEGAFVGGDRLLVQRLGTQALTDLVPGGGREVVVSGGACRKAAMQRQDGVPVATACGFAAPQEVQRVGLVRMVLDDPAIDVACLQRVAGKQLPGGDRVHFLDRQH